MNESKLQREIRLALGARDDIVVWRNNVGTLKDQRGQFVKFGLCTGSSDLIGIHKPTGRFVAIEIKSANGKRSDYQRLFADLVESCGGLYILAFSVADVVDRLDALCPNQ